MEFTRGIIRESFHGRYELHFYPTNPDAQYWVKDIVVGDWVYSSKFLSAALKEFWKREDAENVWHEDPVNRIEDGDYGDLLYKAPPELEHLIKMICTEHIKFYRRGGEPSGTV